MNKKIAQDLLKPFNLMKILVLYDVTINHTLSLQKQNKLSSCTYHLQRSDSITFKKSNTI